VSLVATDKAAGGATGGVFFGGNDAHTDRVSESRIQWIAPGSNALGGAKGTWNFQNFVEPELDEAAESKTPPVLWRLDITESGVTTFYANNQPVACPAHARLRGGMLGFFVDAGIEMAVKKLAVLPFLVEEPTLARVQVRMLSATRSEHMPGMCIDLEAPEFTAPKLVECSPFIDAQWWEWSGTGLRSSKTGAFLGVSKGKAAIMVAADRCPLNKGCEDHASDSLLEWDGKRFRYHPDDASVSTCLVADSTTSSIAFRQCALDGSQYELLRPRLGFLEIGEKGCSQELKCMGDAKCLEGMCVQKCTSPDDPRQSTGLCMWQSGEVPDGMSCGEAMPDGSHHDACESHNCNAIPPG
jgi:hypothetical protein